MKKKSIRAITEYSRTQALRPVPTRHTDEYQIYHLENDRTIQTRVGWNVRMNLNAVDTEGDV